MLEASNISKNGTLAVSSLDRLWEIARRTTLVLRRPSAGYFALAVTALIILIAGSSRFLPRDSIVARPEHIVLSLAGSTSLGDELMALPFRR